MTERNIIALEDGMAAEVFDELDSTNAEALRRIRAGKPREEWIVAQRQTAGRGRQGRVWVSDGGNLFATRVVHAACPRNRAPELSFVAALAVHDAVGLVLASGPKVTCKWPNDVLINGRKVAGTLLETEGAGDRAEWVAIGIGINVARAPAEALFPATSLVAEGGGDDRDAVLGHLNARLAFWLGVWRDQGFGPVRNAWKQVGAGVGEEVTVRLGEDQVSGRFRDMDAHGALVLELETGEARTITAGDVVWPGE